MIMYTKLHIDVIDKFLFTVTDKILNKKTQVKKCRKKYIYKK